MDLDNDGYLEVVAVTTGDEIMALNHDGSKRWINPNYVIEPASYFSGELNLDFWPADLFSSVTPANIDRDVRPELILGAYNGLVFLDHGGEPKYSQAHTGRYYFSTPVVLDLEGDYSNIDMDGNVLSHYKDLEILTGSDDTNRNAYFECWHATGGDVFDYTAAHSGESAFVLGIAVGELSGTMEDDKYDEKEKEQAWMEIVFATHDKGMRIYHKTGEQFKSDHGHNHPVYEDDTSFTVSGHLSYATAAVGNFSKVVNPNQPTKLEIIVGKGGWHGGQPGTPISTGAGVFCYDEDGQEAWHAADGNIIVSSPAVGDVQTQDRDEATKHLAEYEIFACNSHEGAIFSIDADDGTELWSWQIDGAKSTENRILSSPAICNIDSDNELEVIVGSDNGKVYAFDGDPSDANNDGEEFSQYSGEGTAAFDLLWEFDTHEYTDKVAKVGKIGISSPVVADIDKDGMLEVVIGDTVGNIWCISAGGTSSRGQRDWTMFHYDVNNSGFYDPRVSYSVDIKSARDPSTGVIDSREKWVEPGQMVTYNLSIINDGSGLSQEDYDNIYIDVYVPKSNYTLNPGWYYTLDGNAVQEHDNLQFVRLPMQESTTVQLNVTAPWSGDMGDYIDIVVKVNSSMDNNAMASTITTTHLQIKIDFNLEFNWLPETDPQSPFYNKKLDEIMPGEQRTYTITIQNIGNINDTYRISIIDYQRGWNIRFKDNDDPFNYTVQLDSAIFEGAENYTQVQLTVHVPDDEGGEEVTFITIEGVSLTSEAEQLKPHPLIGRIVRKDTMLIRIGDLPKLLLECDEDEKYIMPGEEEKYMVYVTNNGNVDFSVALTYSETSPGWSVRMKSAVEVRSGETKLVEVYLAAPSEEYQVKAETREMVTIEGRVDTTAKGILTSSVGIVGVMDHVYHLNVSVTPKVNTTSPGGMVKYKVTIENLGNGDDEIKLSPLDLELSWNMTFSKGDKFPIEWKEMLQIEFEIRVPETALAGGYTSILNVSDSNPKEKNHVKVKTIVLQSYDMSLGAYNEEHDLYMPSTTQYVTPGSSTMYEILVTNNGNGEDTADISLWLYQFQKPNPGGGLNTVEKTKIESDSMLDEAVKSGGVHWYIKSVQSSRSTLSSDVIITDFNNNISVDRVAEVSYQPSSDLEYPTGTQLILNAGQHAWLNIEIDYPSDENMDPMWFYIEVESAGARETNSADLTPDNNLVDLTLEVKYSDLTFDTTLGKNGLEISGKRSEDSPQLNMRATIRNIGEIFAKNVEIALFIDGQYLDSRKVEILVNSTGTEYHDILVAFSWKPVAGSHKIEIKIDPDELIVESNENNNVVSETVNIEEQSAFTSFLSNRLTCPIIFVILAAAIVGITIYYVLRSKKEEEE
ncbi:MAG: hypothetical protein JSV49_12660 [Thermoplasmata archaeon]|nr:MAG: hypothetical protein JSV49_12660 [Thermoplasmata archaeon]